MHRFHGALIVIAVAAGGLAAQSPPGIVRTLPDSGEDWGYTTPPNRLTGDWVPLTFLP
ncbi:MAG: hypothetical protein ACYTCU_03775 [Planctomycetota bacterium]|jgi:hypothetical protein